MANDTESVRERDRQAQKERAREHYIAIFGDFDINFVKYSADCSEVTSLDFNREHKRNPFIPNRIPDSLGASK